MKKYFLYILLAALVIGTSVVSCNLAQKDDKQKEVVLTDEQRNELEADIEEANKRTPFMFGNIGMVKRLDLKGSHLRLFVEINPNYFKLSKIKDNKNTMREDFYSNLCILDNSFDPLFKKLAEYEAGLRVELSSEDVEDYVEIYYNANELMKLGTTSQSDFNPRDVLKSHIAAYNLSLPMRAKDYIILSSIAIEDEYMQFNFSVEEKKGNEMNRIRAAKPFMAKRMLQSLKTSEAHSIREVLDLCRRSGYGICYRYTGMKTEQQVTIYFEHDDL